MKLITAKITRCPGGVWVHTTFQTVRGSYAFGRRHPNTGAAMLCLAEISASRGPDCEIHLI